VPESAAAQGGSEDAKLLRFPDIHGDFVVFVEMPPSISLEKGQEILRTSGLDFLVADGMQDAAEKVVRAAGGR